MRLAQDGREIGLARVVLSEGYFGPLSQCSGRATRRANRVIEDRDIDRLARNRVRSPLRTRRRFVLPFRAAIANTTAFRSFFEPKDHLTNGSLVAQFASIFSPEVLETTVCAIGAGEFDYFFRTSERVLVNVEGYEPDLMAAFKDIALRYRPDFLIEVLTGTAEALERLDYLHAYERFLLTPQGPVRRPRLEVDQHHRDWLLRLPASPAG